MLRRRITCRTVRDLLPLHCGGDLPPEKGVLVDEHLHACLACFREFREHAAMRGRLGVLAEEPLPEGALDDFTDEVMARIAVGEDGPAAALPSAPGWRRFDVPAVRFAAAAALLVALGVGAWQSDLIHFGSSPTAPDAGATLAAADTHASVATPSASTPAESEPRRSPAPVRSLGTLVGDGNGVPTGFAEPQLPPTLQPLPQWRLSNGLIPEPGRVRRLRDAQDPR